MARGNDAGSFERAMELPCTRPVRASAMASRPILSLGNGIAVSACGYCSLRQRATG